jgi:hypothetical protein
VLDEVEEDVDPFGRREVRVILLIRAIGVSEAREYLDDALHLRTIAHAPGKAQARFGRTGASSRPGTDRAITAGGFHEITPAIYLMIPSRLRLAAIR